MISPPASPSMVAGRRHYASPPGQQRVRRATDVLAPAASLLGPAGLIAAQPPGPFEHTLVRFLASIPDWLTPVWSFLVGTVVLWSLAMIVAPLVSRRPRNTLEALLAMALAIVLGLLAARLATGAGPASILQPACRSIAGSRQCGWPWRRR